MHPALAAYLFEALELAKGISVVVNAQVQIGPLLVAIDQQRRRLLAALVAARGIAGAQRRDQTPRERQLLLRGIGSCGLVEHPGTGQHVAGDRKPTALEMAAPADAFAAGMRSDT